MAKSKKSSEFKYDQHPEINIPDEDHPDFVAGTVAEDTHDDEEIRAEDLIERDFANPDAPEAVDETQGFHWPAPPAFPGRRWPFQFQFCSAVSGRYSYLPRWIRQPPTFPGPFHPVPLNLLRINVRVDVDRYLPQQRISIEVRRLFPQSTSHVIAEVTSDTCLAFNRRRVVANIVYRDGNAALIPGTTVTFDARRTIGLNYSNFSIKLSGGIIPKTYNLAFQSRYFDPVEFEVDTVANAGTATTTYGTGSHPNRPANLPIETLSLKKVYQRAGFDAQMSPNASAIPNSGAGSNGSWSDNEMHNAMITYWSRFTNQSRWALWVLFAKQHDLGYGLGGVMFDDIGANHRQGTAIFTDSFVQDVPPGDPSPVSWQQRMLFWTAVHEMGHAFNLAHSWQKSLGNPWIPLANEPQARSFMNYPFFVTGGQSSFFSDFRFHFSNDELVFMRHAPRRFVQMGNSNWFENHGFEAPDQLESSGSWAFEIRPNKSENAFRFLEPVMLEGKLTNTSAEQVETADNLLEHGDHLSFLIQKSGGDLKQWKPMVSHLEKSGTQKLDPGEATYGAHMISTSTGDWTIDEPGFYKIQAAISIGSEIVVSNVLRIYVTPPMTAEESMLAPDYFTEDVGRVMSFKGAPELEQATAVLKRLAKVGGNNPAVKHAEIALSTPQLKDYKMLDLSGGKEKARITAKAANPENAQKVQSTSMLKDHDVACNTMGHIRYFDQMRTLTDAVEDAGDKKGAVVLLEKTIQVMKKRDILPSVIYNAEQRLKRRK